MPTPQEHLLLVEQASCLFLWTGKMPTHKKLMCCGTGILPVSLGGKDAYPTRI
jgi:hypothetical protein